MSFTYSVCAECLTDAADDHMNTNQPRVDSSSHLNEDFTWLLHSCYVLELILSQQLHLQNVLQISGRN